MVTESSKIGFEFHELYKLRCPMGSLLRKSLVCKLNIHSTDFQGDVIIKPLTTLTACSPLLAIPQDLTLLFEDQFLTIHISNKRSTETHTCVEIFEIDASVMPLRMFKNGLVNYYTFMVDNKNGILSDVFTCTGTYKEPRIKSAIKIIEEDGEHTPDEIAFASTVFIALKCVLLFTNASVVTEFWETKTVLGMKKGKRKKQIKRLYKYAQLTE